MFKEGIPNQSENKAIKLTNNYGEKENREETFQRMSRLSIIGGALTALLIGGLAERDHLYKMDHEKDDQEEVNKNIYLPAEKPELQEIKEVKFQEKNITKENKPVFIETEINKEITNIEIQLLNETPAYGAEAKKLHREIPNSSEYYKAPHIPYKHLLDKPGFPNVKPFGRETIYGNESENWRIIEALKYKVLTSAVERRYNLPPNLIMAMIIQESGAKEFLPNESGDGGFGLSHMQGETAQRFGLKTPCHSLVCNGTNRSCKDNDGNNLNHGKTLKETIEKEKVKASEHDYDPRGKLSNEDERLNHLANIDAVGRMLARGIHNWKPDSRKYGIKEIDNDPLKTAICIYSGTVNFNKYWKNVQKYIKELDNTSKLQKEWGKKEHPHSDTTLNTYLYELQHFNAINYGVKEYVELPCYTSSNSPTVLKEFKKELPKHPLQFFFIKKK